MHINCTLVILRRWLIRRESSYYTVYPMPLLICLSPDNGRPSKHNHLDPLPTTLATLYEDRCDNKKCLLQVHRKITAYIDRVDGIST